MIVAEEDRQLSVLHHRVKLADAVVGELTRRILMLSKHTSLTSYITANLPLKTVVREEILKQLLDPPSPFLRLLTPQPMMINLYPH